MAEETPDKETKEEETLETSEEKKEEKTEEEKSSEKESEEEASTETEKPSEEEEPPLRIPSEEGSQTKEEKRLGFETRTLRKENKRLREESGELAKDDEDDKVEGLRQEMNEKLGVIADKGESEGLLSQFLRKYPSYQKYEGKIRKYMDHPAYRQIPIGFIADGLAGQDLVEEGAEKSKKAEKEAGETKSGGSSQRGALGKEPDIWSMTKDQFKKYQDKIRQKGRE